MAENNKKTTKQDSIIAPVMVLISNPVLVKTDTCPPPFTELIPTTSGTKLKNGKPVSYSPPESKPADFLSLMHTYTTDDGLALDNIACAIMDKTGNLWFGTLGGGVSRYDGHSFTNYTTAHGLPNNNVLSIAEDKKGNLWFGTSGGGVSCYDGHSFINFNTVQGLANDNVLRIIADKKGNIWFGTLGGGVSRYNGKNFVKYTVTEGLAHNNVLSITEDRSGNLWFGTQGGGVSRYDGKSFTNYTIEQGLANNTIRTITEDKKGNLWFGTSGGGLSCYDGKSFSSYTTEQGLLNNTILSITEDKKGHLWFGSNGGVSRYDGTSFVNFTTAQGLANNNVKSITEDKTGNLWFGTQGGGVSRYDGQAFINYTKAQGLTNNIVISIKEDKTGNLWFGTSGGGVSCYDGMFFTNYTTAQGLENNTVFSILEDKMGNLWFGTYGGGVSRFDGKSFTTYTKAQGLAHNNVLSILEDKAGNLWFGTYGGGVSCYDGEYFTTYSTEQGLAGNDVVSIVEDKKGNIWFGTLGGGVSCYDGKSFSNYKIAQGLANDIVLSITEDEAGNLWFGTSGGGVSRYDGKTFVNYTTAQGLPDNTVTQVVITKEQNIVIGTNFGVVVKNQTADFEVYNSSTGYPVKDVNAGQGAMYKDSKGIIWIATGADKTALVRFDYAALNRNNKRPEVFIQSIKINNENICWHDVKNKGRSSNIDSAKALLNITEEVTTFGRTLSQEERNKMQTKFGDIQFDSVAKFYPIPENMVLPYEHNYVTFDFAAIEPARPYLVRYQYILEGYNDDWSPVTNKTSTTFGNIYEGTYTFKLKAQSPFGVWSEPIEYKFTVLPPWWRTWWMYSIYAVLAIAIVVLIVWLNGRKLRDRAKRLNQKINEATVEIRVQKEVVEEQKKIVEAKNKDITDSINYALRIQQAFLPSRKEIASAFPQSFILFKPKDIVSGDFYFFQKMLSNKSDKELFYIAAADCTGHGVPGAFMSMVCSERLTDAVQKSNDTSEILSLLNMGVRMSLKQSAKNQATRDGMDIAICCIDIKNRIVEFAGANRPLWIIRKEMSEVEAIRGTPTAIGGLTEDSQHFETHTLKLQQGDTIYLFSDGYADTFSGISGKKLMTKKFKQILLNIQNQSMQEQEKHLNNFIENWKDGTEQVDDILVIGIRV